LNPAAIVVVTIDTRTLAINVGNVDNARRWSLL
jgi:hypothetical protein